MKLRTSAWSVGISTDETSNTGADDASNSLDFEELREGDSVIKRNSKRDQLKDYMALIKEANEALDILVSKYNTYQSPPSQIIEKGSYN